MKAKKEPLVKLLSPSFSTAEEKAVQKVLKSGWWGLGPVTGEFENEFAKFVGAKYAVAVNSCSAALHLAVKSLPTNRSKKNKIIVPALTFVATAAAPFYEGYEVEFADIDEETYCLDPKDVAKRLDRRTAAVIPVNYAGRLADISYGSSVTIIEDCAHAAGTKNAGKRGIAACWSFHPVKNIATGDAGMLTTNDKKIYDRVKKLRWYGIDMSTYDRDKKGYAWEYSIEELGFKYHSNDIMAAIGLAQLKRLGQLNKKRENIAKRYQKELKGLPLILPPESGSWHLFVIRVDKKYRNKLLDHLRSRNISSGVHYKPLYYYPAFGYGINRAKKELPITDRIWQEMISLPIYPDLTEKEQERVIDTIRNFF